MLIAEKAFGQIDDAPFVAYWDSLGFKKDKQVGYNSFAYKKDLSDGNGRERPITVQITTRGDERYFALNAKDHSLCWYLFSRLKEFGLKGSNAVGKGKGLTAVAHENRLTISYKLPEKTKEKVKKGHHDTSKELGTHSERQ